MRFRITGPDVALAPPLVVESDRWWDARNVGVIHFACEPGQLVFEQTTAAPDVKTEWLGRPPNQRLAFRRRNGDEPMFKAHAQWIDEYAINNPTK